VTDDFVMLNFPKTGSSFARHVIKKLYAQRLSRWRAALEALRICPRSVKDLRMPKIDEDLHYGIKDQHGTLRQIPSAHRHKRILTITRNPLSRYWSAYRFRWWAEHPPVDKSVILERYPHFPELSFSEYYEMMHIYGRANRLRGIRPKADVGLYTIQFIQFYFKDPDAVLKKLDDEYIGNDTFRVDMGENIRFIHQENMESELKEFLLEIGFSPEELAFIDTTAKINVTGGTSDSGEQRDDGLDAESVEAILQRDRLLFRLFPEYLPVEGRSA